MIDVIEINPAHGQIAQLLDRRSALDVGENAVGLGGLEREWNKAAEPAGFILELAQLAQVIDALGERFDVAIKHRARAAAAHPMPRAMHLERSEERRVGKE